MATEMLADEFTRGYHSMLINGKHTYDEWGLVPTTRPVVNLPPVKTSYVEIPSADGVIDFTEDLTGQPLYGLRTGSWEFWCRPEYTEAHQYQNWVEIHQDLVNWIHGKRCTVVLEDDRRFYYVGRLSVDWKSQESNSLVTINYELDPYKLHIVASDDEDWKWDNVFEKYIQYGRFEVNGTVVRNVINMGIRPTVPTITVTEPMTVEFEGVTYQLVKGLNYNLNLTLQPEGTDHTNNIMTFRGNGTAIISYREVSL